MFSRIPPRLAATATRRVDVKRRKFLDAKFPGRDTFGALSDPRRLPHLSAESPGILGRATADDLERFYMEKFRVSQSPAEKAKIMEEFVVKLEELKNGNFSETPALKAAALKSIERTEYTKISDLPKSPQSSTPSPLLEVWREFSWPPAATTILHDTEIATNIRSVMEEYRAAQTGAVVVDESYRKFFKISGRDREIVVDHFASLGIRKSANGEFRFSCLLDSKGLILDIVQIGNCGEEICVLTSGLHAVSVGNFISQYLSFARSGGLEVEISDYTNTFPIFSVYGPGAAEAVAEIGASWKFRIPGDSGEGGDHVDLRDLPNDGCMEISPGGMYVIRSNAISDCYTFVISDQSQITPASVIAKLREAVTPTGIYAFDSLRMERGFPRPGVDVTSLMSPVKAGLVWMLDQEKLRDRKLFGWKQISAQLTKAPSHRRVGFVAEEFVHAGCRILSAPHRRLIGEVTSCAWSPTLGRRLCQGLLKPEYAKIDTQIFVSVPFDLPEDLTKDIRARFLKQGMQRRKFRRLVSCRVLAFPVVTASEANSTLKFPSMTRKRSRRPNPTVAMKMQEGRDRRRVRAGAAQLPAAAGEEQERSLAFSD